ncbi:MAG: transposase, partial [Gammaproteobacteria bacterium]|nr:transposase [Gammaproteobacteria bacterium]
KRGAIPEQFPPVLARLNINPESYLTHMQGHQKLSTPRMLGHVTRLHVTLQKLPQRFIRGVNQSRMLFS